MHGTYSILLKDDDGDKRGYPMMVMVIYICEVYDNHFLDLPPKN